MSVHDTKLQLWRYGADLDPDPGTFLIAWMLLSYFSRAVSDRWWRDSMHYTGCFPTSSETYFAYFGFRSGIKHCDDDYSFITGKNKCTVHSAARTVNDYIWKLK